MEKEEEEAGARFPQSKERHVLPLESRGGERCRLWFLLCTRRTATSSLSRIAHGAYFLQFAQQSVPVSQSLRAALDEDALKLLCKSRSALTHHDADAYS